MNSPKVLMLGWELPPYHTGGLGEACLGLTKALSEKGVGITFVLPKKKDFNINFINLVFADMGEEDKFLTAYTTNVSVSKMFLTDDIPPDYIQASFKYAEKMEKLAQKMIGKFDLIHSHDWMTYPAGVAAKKILGKPLVSHVHSTEFDRTGGNWPNESVYQIEKKGFEASDRVLPVGGLMVKTLIEKYGVAPGKINVIYNGIDSTKKDLAPALSPLKKMGYKIVLFFGRITLQKGPEYFVRSAKIVLNYHPKTIFVVGGSGDMQEFMISEAARLGILDKFIFTGALWQDDRDRLLQAADIYVMPSVSEPFGIVALEAVVNQTPVLISKQAGVGEILQHALKADFWDVEEMANKIISVLKNNALPKVLREESNKELSGFSWSKSADKVIEVYRELI